jgi:hypothetical protein
MLESKFRVFDMRTQHPAEGFAHLTEKARPRLKNNPKTQRLTACELGHRRRVNATTED